MTTAYDYDRQTWVTGDEAARLLEAQLTETRELVAGPQGAEYLRFTGDKRKVAAVLASIDAQLADLGDEADLIEAQSRGPGWTL